MSKFLLHAITLAAVFTIWASPSFADEELIVANAELHEQVLSIPDDSVFPVSLVVTVLTPGGAGPFPLVIMNHGSSGMAKPNLEPRYWHTLSAQYFLSRGYAVVLPMMQGYAGSQGHQIFYGCNQEAAGISNARDIHAVIDYMTMQPYIDASHVVVAGQSFGGWNALAYGTLGDSRVRGIINFAGGVNVSDCVDTQNALALAAGDFGAQTTIPSIWFYGDNDSEFSATVWRSMYHRYTAAGGQAELVAYGPFLSDSHNLLGYPEGLKMWVPRVDTFLARIGLPNTITHPEFLPMDFPPSSHFAAINNVDAVPYLNASGRDAYRIFLTRPFPRVFVISAKGVAASFYGGFDPLGRALATCREFGQRCEVYAVDNDVTWAPLASAPLW